MEAWERVILARVNGEVTAKFNTETDAVRQMWEELKRYKDQRPTLADTVMTAAQLTALTRACHMFGRSSELTRDLLVAFGVGWGWPPELPEHERRIESQQVLVPVRPVPVQTPAPASEIPPLGVAMGTPPVSEPLDIETLAGLYPKLFGPNGRYEAKERAKSGFVEVPPEAASVAPEVAATPAPEPPQPAPEPPKPPRQPDGPSTRGRGRDTAVVTVIDDAPPG